MSRGVRCLSVCLSALALSLLSCTTSVDPSPHPGLLRVTLKSAEVDTSLIILSDTTRFSRYDAFNAVTYSGRIYTGDGYSPIYANPSIARVEADTLNLLGREWLNGVPITIRDSTTITPANSRYRKYVIFESLVPPQAYSMLQFSLLAGEIATYIPKFYTNPVQLPPGTPPQLMFPLSFTVQEDKTTQINIEIMPFKSLRRYQDSFLFDRKVQVVSVQVM